MDNFCLVLFFIIKIVVIIIAPIALFIFRKNEIKSSYIWTEIIALVVVALLYLFGFSYMTDSNLTTIKNLKLLSKSSSSTLKRDNEIKIKRYTRVFSTKKYHTKDNKYAYYYSINSIPLSEVKLSCDKEVYMSTYGESITAITTLISNLYDTDMNEINVLSYLNENNLVDCENGIDFDLAINKLGDRFYYKAFQISSNQVFDYISSGKSVLVETTNKYNEKNNFGCNKDYIVIYNSDNEGNFNIINPNDKKFDYFCPSNTIGYGSIIEKNQNDKTYTFNDINSKALRYFVIEVK